MEKILARNYLSLLECNKVSENEFIPEVHSFDSVAYIPKRIVDMESVDLVLTSPPYGDSRTTVAYGQFSRLSWQWINKDSNIYSLDDNLLGGKKNFDLNNEILEYSPVLKEQLNQIKTNCNKRAKDVLSFYIDLHKTLINAFYYLKRDKKRVGKDLTMILSEDVGKQKKYNDIKENEILETFEDFKKIYNK